MLGALSVNLLSETMWYFLSPLYPFSFSFFSACFLALGSWSFSHYPSLSGFPPFQDCLSMGATVVIHDRTACVRVTKSPCGCLPGIQLVGQEVEWRRSQYPCQGWLPFEPRITG